MAAARCEREQARINAEFENTKTRLEQEWKDAVETAERQREARPRWSDEKGSRAAANSERLHPARGWLGSNRAHAEAVAGPAARRRGAGETAPGHPWREEGETHGRAPGPVQTLAAEWKNSIQPIGDAIRAAQATAHKRCFPTGLRRAGTSGRPRRSSPTPRRCARLEVNVDELAEGAPQTRVCALPLASRFPCHCC